MALGDFDANYPSSPWGNITTNQRKYYEAKLQRDYWATHSIFGKFVETQFNLGAVDAKTMSLTNIIQPQANFNAIGNSTLWGPSSRIDSASRDVTFNHYFGKLAFGKFDRMVTYWKNDNDQGLAAIVREALGEMQTTQLEYLARNAFLSHARKLIGDGSLSGFNQVISSTLLSSAIIEDVHLGMAERNIPYAIAPDGQANAIFCLTTPGVIRGIRESATAGDWLDVMKYNSTMKIANREIGTWKGVRFVQSNLACLYNTGPVTTQTSVSAAITQGDGAQEASFGGLVNGVWTVGQQSGVTRYITVTSAAGFAVGDFVTIHTNRTSTNGVTNGVDFLDGTQELREIRKISSNQISFDKPIMETFSTDLGGGIYAWMTKGRHIHTATFIGGPGGVALGVSQKPEIYTPDELGIIDDVRGMYRFTWDAFLGYAPFTPEVYECWIGAAKNRETFGASHI